MATIIDVAKKAGVSKSTVSNVFSKKRPIGQAVTRRVLEAAKELGYRPTYWAKSQGQPKHRIIGLLLQHQTPLTGFHFLLISGIVEACREYGYRLLFNTVPQAWTVEPSYVADSPVDGEIVLDPKQRDTRIDERIKQGMPMVVIGRPPLAYAAHLSSVDNDNIGAAQQVTDYLLELGHTDIAFFNAQQDTTVAMVREAGYRSAYLARGLKVKDRLLLYKNGGEAAETDDLLLMKLLNSGSRPSAIITDSDLEAAAVYRIAKELGINIPGDLSVFAILDTGEASAELRPELSTVELRAEDLGFEAAKLLIERCEGRSKQVKQVNIGTELKRKGSCTKKT
ncbi:LacI family DNA-binding transcriptional regulator [Paenibacillus sp. CN-4]|uniref:LacI family DNA-binding transcriptional regulator n=1 Tax=Paenibacillus nanchangensis TaxID=3348343 RepID=UPI0039787AB4